MQSKFGVIRLKPTATVTLLSCCTYFVPSAGSGNSWTFPGRATGLGVGQWGSETLHWFAGGCRCTLHLPDGRRKIEQVVVVSSSAHSAHSAPDLILKNHFQSCSCFPCAAIPGGSKEGLTQNAVHFAGLRSAERSLGSFQL